MSEDRIPYTPVKGYRELNAEELEDMNALKELEAAVLYRIAELGRSLEGYHPHWLSRGQITIEMGFMALNRAIARPKPVQLPADPFYPDGAP